MWPHTSSAAHYGGAGGDYSCQRGHEQTFQGFMGSNFRKGVSLIFLNGVGNVFPGSLMLFAHRVMNVVKRLSNGEVFCVFFFFFPLPLFCVLQLDHMHLSKSFVCFRALTVITGNHHIV